MHTVSALLKLNKQMAKFENDRAEERANHEILMNELRTTMSAMDDIDRRLSATTTALSRSNVLNPADSPLISTARLLQLEDKSKAKLTDHIHKGTLNIDGISPNKK